MTIPGHVQNGVVVLDGDQSLPEGAAVVISYQGVSTIRTDASKTRIQVPLVQTGRPGTVELTGQKIAEILAEEDAVSRR